MRLASLATISDVSKYYISGKLIRCHVTNGRTSRNDDTAIKMMWEATLQHSLIIIFVFFSKPTDPANARHLYSFKANGLALVTPGRSLYNIVKQRGLYVCFQSSCAVELVDTACSTDFPASWKVVV